VMQVVNNYEQQVFNGDLGRVETITPAEQRFAVRFDCGLVSYPYDEAEQVRLAYAVTIHKAQGSEYPAVVVPVLTQHYIMLQRQLLYTAMTRARQLLVLVGARRALELAVQNVNRTPRCTRLAARLAEGGA